MVSSNSGRYFGIVGCDSARVGMVLNEGFDLFDFRVTVFQRVFASNPWHVRHLDRGLSHLPTFGGGAVNKMVTALARGCPHSHKLCVKPSEFAFSLTARLI